MINFIFILAAILCIFEVKANSQDGPPLRKENPLKDFTGFNVNMVFHFLLQVDHAKIAKIARSKFEKFEKVLVFDTDKGVDFNGYQGNTTLYYEIQGVKTFDGKNTALSRASLSLETIINVEKLSKNYPRIFGQPLVF